MRTPGLDPCNKRVHVVLRADEHALLLEQVKASGLSITDVVRCLVRRGSSERWWAAPAPAAGPRKAAPR